MKDPVCGMSVDPSEALGADHEGQTYYFCSEDCRKSFLQEPEKYLGHGHEEHHGH